MPDSMYLHSACQTCPISPRIPRIRGEGTRGVKSRICGLQEQREIFETLTANRKKRGALVRLAYHGKVTKLPRYIAWLRLARGRGTTPCPKYLSPIHIQQGVPPNSSSTVPKTPPLLSVWENVWESMQSHP